MTHTAHDTTVHINPTTWNAGFHYDQAQLRRAPEMLLTLAGQGPVDASGQLLHPGEVAPQLAAAFANVEELLAAGGMGLRDVLRMTVFTTDVDGTLAAYGAIVSRLAAAGATPPATLVGVTRLAIPGMTVEIEVTAGR
ncbi:enamine deaminase RidA (YjgF/YER057c/UK114 family) [Motilibacter rhizosphaerae]|uniref:Enamine deaminase RidA (YjgF/YER057c/UK114 family) n=1 Tax=Motilibacter rhizosphaerae TaxID=598652 RepID=A0A4Q7NAI5_9ACTN|nr:RidA family protein [Motilibacter rhizosphaerae]RZS79938.1 enamine deaminase RidA (YjgF/YER057c/UK114 family) [Motilibacter rhizosphaerae]